MTVDGFCSKIWPNLQSVLSISRQFKKLCSVVKPECNCWMKKVLCLPYNRSSGEFIWAPVIVFSHYCVLKQRRPMWNKTLKNTQALPSRPWPQVRLDGPILRVTLAVSGIIAGKKGNKESFSTLPFLSCVYENNNIYGQRFPKVIVNQSNGIQRQSPH